MFQCQTYKCTINANKEGEASLLKNKNIMTSDFIPIYDVVFDMMTSDFTPNI